MSGWTVSTTSDPSKISPELGAAQAPSQRRSPQLPIPNSQQQNSGVNTPLGGAGGRSVASSGRAGISPPSSANATPPVAGMPGPGGGPNRSPEIRSVSLGGTQHQQQHQQLQQQGQQQSSTSGIPFDPETHVEVYNPANNTLLILSHGDICYLPPLEPPDGGANAAPTHKLCPNFDPQRPFDSCPMNARCKYVHARTDNAVSQDIHVNYAWNNLEDVTYERYPSGQILSIAPPNGSVATDEIPSHWCLKTRALQSNRRVMSHCAHYYFNRMCNRGSSCFFCHAVSLTPLREGAPPPPPEEANIIRRIWGRTHARTKPGAAHQTPPLAPMRAPVPGGGGGSDRGISPIPPYGAEHALVPPPPGGGQQQQQQGSTFSGGGPPPPRGFSVTSANNSFAPAVPNNSFNIAQQQQRMANDALSLSPYAREWDPVVPGSGSGGGSQAFSNFSTGSISGGSSTKNSAMVSPNMTTGILLGGGGGGHSSNGREGGGGGGMTGLPPMDIGPPAVVQQQQQHRDNSFASGSDTLMSKEGSSQNIMGGDSNNSSRAGGASRAPQSSPNLIPENQAEAQVVDNVMQMCDDDD